VPLDLQPVTRWSQLTSWNLVVLVFAIDKPAFPLPRVVNKPPSTSLQP